MECPCPPENDSWFQKLKDWIEDSYYDMCPYESRIGYLWYRFKCFAWHRHTTIKPRFLPHTWCDKSLILPHIVFELLCRFLEDEKPGEVINWESDEAHSQAWKEMNELYDWWLHVYIPWEQDGQYDGYDDIESFHFEKIEGSNCSKIAYSSPEAESKARAFHQKKTEEEVAMDKELVEKCQRVIALKDFMWT